MSEIGLDCKSGDASDDNEAARRGVADARAAWIGELARADADMLARLWLKAGFAPPFETLRGPEIGLVMARGRAGGDGEAFNLGEISATRCVVRLESGEEGVSYALGRDKAKATRAALCDALMQTAAAPTVRAEILAPLEAARRARETAAARKAAATKVEFFTMTRGEDD